MFVYRFRDITNEVIYVGRTNNFIRRIRNEHFTERGHLPEECYRQVVTVEYAEVRSVNDSKMYELYLIDKHEPRYNVIDVGGGGISFPMPELNWKVYVPDKRTRKRGVTKKELKETIESFGEEIEKECDYMNTFLRGKDRVGWLRKLNEEERNIYISTVYMMERFVNGIGEIKDRSMEKIDSKG